MPLPSIPSQFFEQIQKLSLPGVWSQAVSWVRAEVVILDSATAEEMILRVRVPSVPISPRVTLWPEDQDWYCTCQGRTEVCAHVAAVAIALQQEKVQGKTTSVPARIPILLYRFLESPQNELILEREWIRSGHPPEKLKGSLVSWMGGLRSGRVEGPEGAVTQIDYQIDAFLTENKPLKPEQILRLFPLLSSLSHIEFEGMPISVNPHPSKLQVEIVDELDGVRVRRMHDSSVKRVLKNGAILAGTVLKAISIPKLSETARELLTGEGRFFPIHELPLLLKTLLPELEQECQVLRNDQNLPEIQLCPPEMILKLQMDPASERLWVTPEWKALPNRSRSGNGKKVLFLSDPSEEKKLSQKLRHELHLIVGQTTVFSEDAAAEFLMRAQKGIFVQISGNESAQFSEGKRQDEVEFLTPRILANESELDVQFQTQQTGRSVDPAAVFQAWRENRQFVPLLEGGWAALPKDWLSRYGERVLHLLEAKQQSPGLPTYRIPELVELCEQTQQPCSDALKKIRDALVHREAIPEMQMPSDLQVPLRTYQKQGVNWLGFLKQLKMGALLADDMGLGKTLQTLCICEAGTLIVAPSSVLWSWSKQIQEFRPSLSVCIYQGTSRVLDLKKEILLTTYGILRAERKIFEEVPWKMIVLDEAQVVQNPHSQVARAVHALKADFKVALSGTPIQNSLSDLWSLFQFLNPGLLGSRELFEAESQDRERMKKRIQPFILRRLKKEVAPELPSKTEVPLYCELTSAERETYQSVLASTRKELLVQLESSMSGLTVLELLLRLRQVCCDVRLVPGSVTASGSSAVTSSKTQILLAKLKDVMAGGHRALVFSQWTSYLDLIERELSAQQVPFLRLDGQTRHRAAIVEEFQTRSTYPVLLLSLKAGGVGLTLTAADHVFLMDPWWNPTIEAQAADRSHRIGQENPVMVHPVIARNTIEEKILLLQQSKLSLASDLLTPAGSSLLSRQELFALLDDLDLDKEF